jgi:hypothetical protein
LVLSVLGLLALAAPDPARAQAPGQQLIYSPHRQFKIPFTVGPGKQNLKQLKLWVSTDRGKSWEHAAVAAPEQDEFQYIADRDGLHWFAVQTVDKQDRPFPPGLEGVTPHLRVVVDTQPPKVTLRQLPAGKGHVGVAWTVTDDNFDAAARDNLRLEFRPLGALGWTPLQRTPADQAFWKVESDDPVEVRVRAWDRAGNEGTGTLKVTPGSVENNPGQFQPQPIEKEQPQPGGQAPLDPNRKFLNTTTVVLNFEIKDEGPSGIGSLELWYTTDGRSWTKRSLPHKEGMKLQSPVTFDVAKEGVYGITLVARSGVGLGERPPQVGDQPQIWVEVDLTKPVVEIQHVHVGQGADKGKLFIHWKAQDKNLGAAPIGLSYAEKKEGPWVPIAEANLPNTGKYVWEMPQGVPYQFFVRVQATDLAGNVGEAATTYLVRVDLSLPKVKIINVQSGP